MEFEPRRMVFERYDDTPEGYEWGMRLPEGLNLASVWPRSRCRNRWRRQLLGRLYGPWFKALNQVSRCPERVLWENLTYVVVGWLRSRCRAEPEPGHRTHRVRDLIEIGCFGSDGSPAGGEDTSASVREVRALLEQPVRYGRTTCCLNNRVGAYCGACPNHPRSEGSTAGK